MLLELILTGFGIAVLLVISAFLSGTEAAYLAVSRAKLRLEINQGNTKAALVEKLRQTMDRVISTVLITNTFLNIFATSLATGLFIVLFGETGVVIATTTMSILIIVFAELMPKFLAIRQAESYSKMMVKPLEMLIMIGKPIALILEWLTRRILILCGVSWGKNDNLVSSFEELRGAIELTHEIDEVTKESKMMLHSILDLDYVSIEEVLIHRSDVKMINLDDDLTLISRQIIDSHHTRLPLYQNSIDNIIGILHAKDYLRILNNEGLEKLTPQTIISIAKKPWFIPETATLFEQMQAFRKRREHMALVVDEYGTIKGIITLEDIIEEIVGHINDEHDPNLPGVWRTAQGEVYASGHTTIRDLNRQFGWNLPDEQASTIAGLVMFEARTIPEIGRTFKISKYKIKVLHRLSHQINLVKISLLNHDTNTPTTH